MREEELKAIEARAEACENRPGDERYCDDDFARDGWISHEAAYLALVANKAPALVAALREMRGELGVNLPGPRPASAWRSTDPEIERQVSANTAAQQTRAVARAEILGLAASLGLPLKDAAELLEGVAAKLRADAEAMKREGRPK